MALSHPHWSYEKGSDWKIGVKIDYLLQALHFLFALGDEAWNLE